MKNRRHQDETGWPPWATILVVAILLGAFIWQVVPRHIIYLGIGVAIVIIGGVSYLVCKKRGIGVFKSGAKKIYESLKGGTKEIRRPNDVVPPLSADEEARLIDAVGNECENPECHEQLTLTVHHIVPKHEEGSSNKLGNLIVLCRNHHGLADKGEPPQARLRQWISRPDRFRHDPKWKRDE